MRVLPFSDWPVLIFQHSNFAGEADLRARPAAPRQQNLRLGNAHEQVGAQRHKNQTAAPVGFPESPSKAPETSGARLPTKTYCAMITAMGEACAMIGPPTSSGF